MQFPKEGRVQNADDENCTLYGGNVEEEYLQRKWINISTSSHKKNIIYIVNHT